MRRCRSSRSSSAGPIPTGSTSHHNPPDCSPFRLACHDYSPTITTCCPAASSFMTPCMSGCGMPKASVIPGTRSAYLRQSETTPPTRKALVTKTTSGRWLLLFHQIPPKPDYFRVKVWRRLQRIGAVPVKNSVWVLPHSDQAVEDLRWLLQEIVQGGGEGSVCRGDFVDGLSDPDIEALFVTPR